MEKCVLLVLTSYFRRGTYASSTCQLHGSHKVKSEHVTQSPLTAKTINSVHRFLYPQVFLISDQTCCIPGLYFLILHLLSSFKKSYRSYKIGSTTGHALQFNSFHSHREKHYDNPLNHALPNGCSRRGENQPITNKTFGYWT